MKSHAKSMLKPGHRVDLSQIRSLTDFQRNARRAIREMKKSGRPQVLTVNGKAELVVQDAVSYQNMLDAIEEADALEGIRRGVASFERGQGIPARKALDRIRKKHGIPRRAEPRG